MADRWCALLMRTSGNKERDNMLWNMSGSFFYAFASMVLSFLVMRMIGKEQGGIFSFGFSTFGQQMFILAYFGIRPFQVTDGAGEFRFGDYLHHRYVTCFLALAAGAAWLLISGYTAEKAAVLFLLVGYKVIDGFADVYESEFQRNGNLHLTGKSNTFRTILTVGIFLITLMISENLLYACGAAVTAQAAGVLIFDQTVIGQLPGVDFGWDKEKLLTLTGSTVLLFVSVFFDFYVFSAEKYAIDSYLNDAASGYFNIIFMPTSMINLAAGFVIRPVLTMLTDAWNEKNWAQFDSTLKKISVWIAGFSLLAVVGAAVLGRPVLGVLEKVLGESYEGCLTTYFVPFIVCVAGGGFYAFLNLYYYVLVIMRRQKMIFGIYAAMTVIAAIVSPEFVKSYGIPGAAVGYLFLMILMTAGFLVCERASYREERDVSERKIQRKQRWGKEGRK